MVEIRHKDSGSGITEIKLKMKKQTDEHLVKVPMMGKKYLMKGTFSHK